MTRRLHEAFRIWTSPKGANDVHWCEARDEAVVMLPDGDCPMCWAKEPELHPFICHIVRKAA